MLSISALNYALALKKHLHFGKAAEACFVSQPSLSTAIAKLEDNLGTPLFERHRKTVTLTPAGEILLNQAERIIAEVSTLEALAQTQDTDLISPLKLGAIYTVGPYLFPPLIQQLSKTDHSIPLIIEEDYTENIRAKLNNGHLDAAFIALPFAETGILTKALYEEPFVVVMRKDHPLSQKKSLSQEDLMNEEILLLEAGNCFREQVVQSCPMCFQSGHKQSMIGGASLETLRHMVASGFGMTLLPSSAAHAGLYQDLLVTKRFKTNPPKRTIALAWRSSFPRTKLITKLINALQKSGVQDVCLILERSKK